MDVLQVHKNQELDEVFCPHDRKEHLIDTHSSLSRMEVAYQRGEEAATRSKPRKSWPTGMVQNTPSPLSYLHNPLWNADVIAQPCQSQYNYLSCLQVGHGSSYDGMTTLPHLVAQTFLHIFHQLFHNILLAYQIHPLNPINHIITMLHSLHIFLLN